MNLQDQPCLVVGGGEVAARKVSLLLEAGARVTVVAPTLCTTLAKHVAEARITHCAAEFTPMDEMNYALVIAATDDRAINRQVSEAARKRGIPVNVVDSSTLRVR